MDMKDKTITTLFLDIGGVILTNAWDREARNKAIAHFELNSEETNERHHLTFDSYEEGKLTLKEYLQRVVFYETRNFSPDDFIAFMFKQSIPYQETIDFFKQLKKLHSLKIIAVNNEGKELNAYRIKEFKLGTLFDAFVSSCFVHFRKPDADIFRMAVDIAQTGIENSLYIDDRLMFVEVAQSLGMHGIHHQGLETTKAQLKNFGLFIKE
jgi:putative hydrolase of the HAD superfamily